MIEQMSTVAFLLIMFGTMGFGVVMGMLIKSDIFYGDIRKKDI